MRRRALAVLLVGMAAFGATCGPVARTIRFAADVPGDVRTLTASTWQRFEATFPALSSCVAPPEVAVAWQLDSRAAYDPGRRVVTLRIPGTAPNLEASLLHEFGHHLDYTCDRAAEVRPAFLAAQGFSPRAGWRRGSTWESTPAEQFAEAVVRLVLGQRPAHQRVKLSDGAIDVLRSWAGAAHAPGATQTAGTAGPG